MRLKKGIISIVLILAVIAGGLSVNQERCRQVMQILDLNHM